MTPFSIRLARHGEMIEGGGSARGRQRHSGLFQDRPWKTGSCATSLTPLMQNCIPMHTSRKPMMRVMASMPVAPGSAHGIRQPGTPQLIRLIRAKAVTMAA